MMKRTLNLQANLIAEREKFECGLDKLSQTWYNILMRKTMQETFGIYQGKAVVVIAVSEYWNEALVRYAHSGPHGAFKIGLPQLTIEKIA